MKEMEFKWLNYIFESINEELMKKYLIGFCIFFLIIEILIFKMMFLIEVVFLRSYFL